MRTLQHSLAVTVVERSLEAYLEHSVNEKQPRDKVARTFRAYGQILKEEKYPGYLVLIQKATSVARERSYKCACIYMPGKRMRKCVW